MVYNSQKFPFALRMMGIESKVRGIYLTASCDFERLMSDIIAVCEETDKQKVEGNKLKQPLEIGAKLDRCLKAVENHNKTYIELFATEFSIIEKLCYYRTILAHGFSEYDENKKDESYIIFNWVYKNGNKRELRSEKIIVRPFIMEINNYRKNIFEFMKLHAYISIDKGF